MSLTALLDGDEVAYKCAVTSESNIDWGDGNDGKTADTTHAVRSAYQMVRDLSHAAGARSTAPIVCLSPRDRGNFRKTILPSYKANRAGIERPVAYDAIIEMFEQEHKVVRYPDMEGDDVIGLYATSGKGDFVVVSQDKDMQTLPGIRWFNSRTGAMKQITARYADRFWMTQTLVGDSADGYKGCPKVGPVKADKALVSCPSLEYMWRAVVAEFRKQKLKVSEAIVQARVARILRHGDFDFAKRMVRLWHPAGKYEYLAVGDA